MPSRPHARQSIPLACALACALFIGAPIAWRRDAGRGAAYQSGGAAVSMAGAARPRVPPSPPAADESRRWRTARSAPDIPREALRLAAGGETGEVPLTFRQGRLAVRGHVVRIEKRAEENYTLLGVLPGSESPGSWSLVRNGDAVVANFRLPDGGPYLEWRVTPEGVPVEWEILADFLPPCEAAALADHAGTTVPRGAVPDASRAGPPPPPDLDDEPVPTPEIAVLVVYTPAAVVAVGGPSAMEALTYLAIDETNAALADSLALPRLKLVHHQALAYVETNDNLRVDLERLRTPGDGYLDEVGALREWAGADLVSMIALNDTSCGRAYTLVSNPSGFAEYAYSVVAHDCVATNYSFSHEIAHNLGCQHAVGDDNGTVVSGQGIFPYAHGWRFTAATPDATVYRTIMAQMPGLRVPFYSNPGLLVAGAVAGSAQIGDCVRTLNAIGPLAAAWRATPATLYGEAVEQPDWLFQSGGDAPWSVQPIERREGPDALQAGFAPDNGHSWLQTILGGPVQLDFFWKVAIDEPSASLSISVDGVEYGQIRGGSGWKKQEVRLATGAHVVRWTHRRGNAGGALDAVAWIDALRLSPVPMVIHEIHTEGHPVEGVEIAFESIPFQPYVLELTSDFQHWQPLWPITPNDPSARSTEFHAVFPQTVPPEIPASAAFRVRLLE